jgi:hypothetical protein
MPSLRYTKFGIWGMAITILMRFSILYFTALLLKRSRVDDINYVSLIFDWIQIFIFLLLLVELIIYWIISNRLLNILWVRLHVWLTFVALIVFPFLSSFIIAILGARLGLEEMTIFLKQFRQIQLYLMIGLLITANIFFISNIVKAVRPAENNTDNEPPGILDEFVKRN